MFNQFDQVILLRDYINGEDFISAEKTNYAKGTRATILELYEDVALIEVEGYEEFSGVFEVKLNDIEKVE